MDAARPYLAAMIEFLDRDSGKVKNAMVYPVVRITLCQRMHEGNPEGRPWREFHPADDGDTWTELT